MLTQWKGQLDPVLANAILQGNSLGTITLNANTPKPFPHGLNRMPQGWFVTDLTSQAVIWRSAAFTSQLITLESSADTTLSVWVF